MIIGVPHLQHQLSGPKVSEHPPRDHDVAPDHHARGNATQSLGEEPLDLVRGDGDADAEDQVGFGVGGSGDDDPAEEAVPGGGGGGAATWGGGVRDCADGWGVETQVGRERKSDRDTYVFANGGGGALSSLALRSMTAGSAVGTAVMRAVR